MLIRSLRVLFHVIIFLLLTIVTQVGGIVYLFTLLFSRLVSRYLKTKWIKIVLVPGFFCLLYALSTAVITPLVARQLGRVPLPCYDHSNLVPATTLTCICNRHYVVPQLEKLLLEKSTQLKRENPNVIVRYLDANFPFFEGFPLLPHLSHDDGRKVDIAFFYMDAATGNYTPEVPSIIGYGIHENPRPGEVNTTSKCIGQGYWNYDLIRHIIPQGNKQDFIMDMGLTRSLLQLILSDYRTEKVFIEPHLKNRLGLQKYAKLRFHGCHAVRHDDHIHVQL